MALSFWDIFINSEAGLLTSAEINRMDFLMQLRRQGKIPNNVLVYDLCNIARNPLTFYAYIGKYSIKESL